MYDEEDEWEELIEEEEEEEEEGEEDEDDTDSDSDTESESEPESDAEGDEDTTDYKALSEELTRKLAEAAEREANLTGQLSATQGYNRTLMAQLGVSVDNDDTDDSEYEDAPTAIDSLYEDED